MNPTRQTPLFSVSGDNEVEGFEHAHPGLANYRGGGTTPAEHTLRRDPDPNSLLSPWHMWSLWLSGFAALNIVIFGFIVTFFSAADEQIAFDAPVTPQNFVYCLVLLLLALAGGGFLIREYLFRVQRVGQLGDQNTLVFQGSDRDNSLIFCSRLSSDGVLVALATASLLLSFLALTLGIQFEGLPESYTSRLLVEHSVCLVLFASLWVNFRRQLYQALEQNLSLTFFLTPSRQSPLKHGLSDVSNGEEHPISSSGDGESVRLSAGMRAPHRLRVNKGIAIVDMKGRLTNASLPMSRFEMGSLFRLLSRIIRWRGGDNGGKEAFREAPLLRQAGDQILAGGVILRGSVECSLIGEPSPEQYWASEQRHIALQESGERIRSTFSQHQRMLLALILVVLFLVAASLSSAVNGFFVSALSLGGVDIGLVFLSGLALAPLFDVSVLREVFLSGVLRRLYQSGFVLRDFRFFAELARIQRVVFRIGARCPLVGAARTLEFVMVDDRVDSARFCAVIYALLRNEEQPEFVAIRDFCFQRSKKIELFKVEREASDGASFVRGVVQGAEFVIGSEESLIGLGIHLEVSEAFHAQAQLQTRFYVAVSGEVVATFVVEPPFFAEMPRLVAALRARKIRPQLEGVGIEQVELDALGKKLGFELAEIRSSADSGSRVSPIEISSGVGIGAHSDSDTTYYILLSPEEGLPPTASQRRSLTWFRESLWNVSFPGALMVGKALAPAVGLLTAATWYVWGVRMARWITAIGGVVLVGGLLSGQLLLAQAVLVGLLTLVGTFCILSLSERRIHSLL